MSPSECSELAALNRSTPVEVADRGGLLALQVQHASQAG